jgi:tripartite-type tricarboxylate transporter receptor subunit TctC
MTQSAEWPSKHPPDGCTPGEQIVKRQIIKRLVVAAACVVVAASSARADTIKLIVPFAAGGPVDTLARQLAAELQPRLGADVIVEDRGGAGGVIGTESVAHAPADGRTLLLASLGSQVISAALRPQLSYDPVKSFTPIALIGSVASLLVVRMDFPAQSLGELIAKARQGGLSYGSAGPGTTMHITGELFNAAAGVKTSHVPYRGAGPALNDLLGGHIDFLNADLPVLLPLVEGDKVRALALFARERSPLLPSVPTTTELGYPDMIMESWYGLFAPSGISSDQRARLEQAVLQAVAAPTLAERLAAGGLHGTIGSAGFAKKLDQDVAYWGPQIKKLGITGE